MSTFQGLLIAGLVLIAVIHTVSRVGGALATIAWCAAAVVFGIQQFEGVDPAMGLLFAGIQTPQWVFFTAMVCVGLYNVAVVVRALRRMPKRTARAPTPTT